MVARPVVSLVLASYNYERYIGTMIASILAQTFGDIEIIVVDDASTDGSCDVVRSFSDPRIQLYVNERNMGPGWTYNRGGALATGEFIGYLDSDDWLDPRKISFQLDYFRRNPAVDLLGSYVTICDGSGNRHAAADEWEGSINQPHALNMPDKWIGGSRLSAPSVMFRRTLHDRIGFRDATMVRASDYEFWTRALRAGCRFGLVHVPLLFYRVHEKNTSALNASKTFLEVVYSLGKNVLPILTGDDFYLLGKAIHWIVTHEQFALLSETQGFRLLALVLGLRPAATFGAFDHAFANETDDAAQIEMGKRVYMAAKSA